MKYLKLFEGQTDYDVWKNSENYVLPNVSYIVSDDVLSYDADTGIDPNCVIYYTTSGGQVNHDLDNYDVCNANFVSNTYENGRGVLLYDAPITHLKSMAFCDEVNGFGTEYHIVSLTFPPSLTYVEDYFGYGSVFSDYLRFTSPVMPEFEDCYICEQGTVEKIYCPSEYFDTYKQCFTEKRVYAIKNCIVNTLISSFLKPWDGE